FLPGSFLYVQINAQDDHGLKDVFLHFTGAVTGDRLLSLSGTSYSFSWQERVPQNATAGATITVSADLPDQQGHTTTIGPISPTVATDVTPPVLSNARPPDGAKFISGNLVTVGVDATDDVKVASVDIVVDGATTTLTQPPFQITYKAKA